MKKGLAYKPAWQCLPGKGYDEDGPKASMFEILVGLSRLPNPSMLEDVRNTTTVGRKNELPKLAASDVRAQRLDESSFWAPACMALPWLTT
eukprot:548596-Amphidinium_carterae.1